MQPNNENTGQEVPKDTTGEGEQRSEKRYQDLSNKVRDLAQEKENLLREREAEKAQLAQQVKDANFKADFLEASSKYPQAKDFQKDIKAKVDSGYALEDAIISTLATKGKLQPTVTKAEVMGSSAEVRIDSTRNDDPTFGGDLQKMREEVIRLEKENKIGLKF